jgi:hypothetical protein
MMKCILTITSDDIHVEMKSADGHSTIAHLGADGWDNTEVIRVIGDRTDIMDIQEVLEDIAGFGDDAIETGE